MYPHSQGDGTEDSQVLLLLLDALQRSLHFVDGEFKFSSAAAAAAVIAISIAMDAISIRRRWTRREVNEAVVANKLDLGPLIGLQTPGVVIALIVLDRTEGGIGELDNDVLLAIIGIVAVALGHSIVAGR